MYRSGRSMYVSPYTDLPVERSEIPIGSGLGSCVPFSSIKMYEPYETSYPINVHPELVFQKLNPLVHLDLHWRLFPRGFGAKLDFDALWQRRQTVMVAGKVYELACTGLGTVIQFLWRW